MSTTKETSDLERQLKHTFIELCTKRQHEVSGYVNALRARLDSNPCTSDEWSTIIDALNSATKIARAQLSAMHYIEAQPREDPDAQCSSCSKMYYSADGHPTLALCKSCATGVKVGACRWCGRDDVLLRPDGTLTLHDAKSGSACVYKQDAQQDERSKHVADPGKSVVDAANTLPASAPKSTRKKRASVK